MIRIDPHDPLAGVFMPLAFSDPHLLPLLVTRALSFPFLASLSLYTDQEYSSIQTTTIPHTDNTLQHTSPYVSISHLNSTRQRPVDVRGKQSEERGHSIRVSTVSLYGSSRCVAFFLITGGSYLPSSLVTTLCRTASPLRAPERYSSRACMTVLWDSNPNPTTC
jgi:hypothetical protein